MWRRQQRRSGEVLMSHFNRSLALMAAETMQTSGQHFEHLCLPRNNAETLDVGQSLEGQ